MALQGTYELNGQISIANAYIKVHSVSGGKGGYVCRLQVFASKADSDSGKIPINTLVGPSYDYVAQTCPIHLAYLACKAGDFSTYQDA